MGHREIENFFSKQVLISYRIFGDSGEWGCVGDGALGGGRVVYQGWQPSLMQDSEKVKTWARGLAQLVPWRRMQPKWDVLGLLAGG